MWKPVVVATAALAIAGSSLVYAQQRFGGHGGDADGGPRFEHRHHHKMSAEDRAAFTDARIAALRAGLELTPEQAKNWPAFEQSLRDMAALRAQRIAAREARKENPDAPRPAPFDRLSHRADNMAKTSAALKKIADTGAPLYQSLSDGQKERFKKLARMLRPHHHHHFARNEGGQGGDGWRNGPGGGGQGWGHRRFGENEGWQQDGGRMQQLMETQDDDSRL
jgi:zinc resistance-associated protein